jgi:undecaprenyl diphosphate synthase
MVIVDGPRNSAISPLMVTKRVVNLLIEFSEMCLNAGISHVSLWALSKENVSERSPEDELSAIYGLLRRKMPKLIELCQKESIRFQTVGDIWLLPADVRALLLEAIDTTQAGTAMTFILAL